MKSTVFVDDRLALIQLSLLTCQASSHLVKLRTRRPLGGQSRNFGFDQPPQLQLLEKGALGRIEHRRQNGDDRVVSASGKRSVAHPAFYQTHRLQHRKGLPDGDPADLELLGEFTLAWKTVARLEDLTLRERFDLTHDLLVGAGLPDRTEVRRGAVLLVLHLVLMQSLGDQLTRRLLSRI